MKKRLLILAGISYRRKTLSKLSLLLVSLPLPL